MYVYIYIYAHTNAFLTIPRTKILSARSKQNVMEILINELVASPQPTPAEGKVIRPWNKIPLFRGDVSFSSYNDMFLHSAIVRPELHYLNRLDCVSRVASPEGSGGPKDGNKSRRGNPA